jgi:hypothetical protein
MKFLAAEKSSGFPAEVGFGRLGRRSPPALGGIEPKIWALSATLRRAEKTDLEALVTF